MLSVKRNCEKVKTQRRKRNSMKNKLLIIIFLIGLNCSAQEYLSGFSYETRTVDGRQDLRRGNNAVQLPFFDDFTESEVYPNASKWQSNNVLVNSGFPIFPTNFNAVTFDILDNAGKVSNEASRMKSGSIALVNQITTISKIRIYDPKTDNDILSHIRLSDETLNKIDDEIKKMFVYK